MCESWYDWFYEQIQAPYAAQCFGRQAVWDRMQLIAEFFGALVVDDVIVFFDVYSWRRAQICCGAEELTIPITLCLQNQKLLLRRAV